MLVDAQIVGRRELESCSSYQEAPAVVAEDFGGIVERQMGEPVPESRRS